VIFLPNLFLLKEIKMQYNQIETSINFRTVKTKEEDGSVTETKRDSIKLHIPVPSVSDILEMIDAANAPDASEVAKNNLQLLQDALFAVIYEQAVSLAKENVSLTGANFPFEELDWEKIANQPEAERKSRGISKDEWADFADDYLASMPALTGKTEDRVKRAAAVFLLKFAPIKSDKKSIAVLRDQLVVYAEQAPQAANYYKVIEFLLKKADALIEAEVIGSDDF
jgi:hypothetical protein